MEQQTIDDFDRRWLELTRPHKWIDATYALIGLTRLGEQPTTMEQLAAVLGRSQEEASELAWEASRVRPTDGRIHLTAPFGGSGGPVRRRVYVGDREIPVSGCAPDLFLAAAVLDIPFRVEDACSATGVPIEIEFTPEGVERVDPPDAAVAMIAPEAVSEHDVAVVEEANKNICSQQPLFSSAQAAQGWLDAHPGGRVFPVEEILRRPFFTHLRDSLRPRILANMVH